MPPRAPLIIKLLEVTWKEAIWNYFVALSRYLAGRNEKKSRTVPGCVSMEQEYMEQNPV
jgi:hypothetical protein